jgi:HD-GYP domain-containing protein (c-di-GMP phosphodiesterase class II)/pSer/pThr/pTyr-binding forkhead associated (FHA) protein
MDARLHERPHGAVMAYLDVMQAGGAPSRIVPLQDEVLIGRERMREPQNSQVTASSDRAMKQAWQEVAGRGQAAMKAEAVLAEGQEQFIGIAEHTVSRRHARIRRRGTTYFVEDLHSVNGTFVSGERLLPGTLRPLRDGDELSVSTVLLVFHSLLPVSQEAPPAQITGSFDATRFTRQHDLPGKPADGGAVKASPSQLQGTVQKLHAMAQVGIALGAVTDRATLIEKIMKFIFELFPLADRAFILFVKPDDGGKGRAPGLPLVPDAACRRDGVPIDAGAIRLSRTIAREVLENRQAILSVDTLADRHYAQQESIVAQTIRSVMCVPLLLENECLGLIQVDTASDPYAFKEQDLEMLTGVCAEAAVTLKNFQLYSDIERLLDGFVRASVQAIEERDPVTAGHSFRVADCVERLARAVDRADSGAMREVIFSRDQLREIRYAALLHDFGKVGVREHVLRKEKKLHHAELRLLEQRFDAARAGIACQAYRQLVEDHARRGFRHTDFRNRKARIETALAAEFVRLEAFLASVRMANEPAISHVACSVGNGLDDLRDYRYPAGGLEQAMLPLLEPFEFSALNLSKGCLTPDERRQIESHVADSYAFLILIPWTRDLAGVPAIAHGHHEKLDGSGYPLGLRGPEISIQTRMLTICDIFDALTASDRPYKKAVPLADALDLMRGECDAGHIDPVLFDVFTESRAWSVA